MPFINQCLLFRILVANKHNTVALIQITIWLYCIILVDRTWNASQRSNQHHAKRDANS